MPASHSRNTSSSGSAQRGATRLEDLNARDFGHIEGKRAGHFRVVANPKLLKLLEGAHAFRKEPLSALLYNLSDRWRLKPRKPCGNGSGQLVPVQMQGFQHLEIAELRRNWTGQLVPVETQDIQACQIAQRTGISR